jgi:hypothetical protein
MGDWSTGAVVGVSIVEAEGVSTVEADGAAVGVWLVLPANRPMS